MSRDPLLVCHGCAHSAASEPFPGKPSGERPCLFCNRNPNPAEAQAIINTIRAKLPEGKKYTARYDNGPVRQDIGDQYIATDRLVRDLPPNDMVIT